jgi:hypothetical protein
MKKVLFCLSPNLIGDKVRGQATFALKPSRREEKLKEKLGKNWTGALLFYFFSFLCQK